MVLRIDCREGNSKGARFSSSAKEVSIGRSRDNEIRLPTAEEGVSGHHCLLFRRGQDWLVRDLGSTNGTFLNGFRVDRDLVVEEGDTLRFGSRGPLFVIGFGDGNETLALPIEAGAGGPGRRGRGLVLFVVVVLVALIAAAVYFEGDRIKSFLGRYLPIERAAGPTGDPSADQPANLPDPGGRDQELVDPPELPLDQLPPLEDWILGRWRLARQDEAGPAVAEAGDEALLIEIARDPDDADLYLARVVEVGGARAAREGLATIADRPLLRFRYLAENSRRGGCAYFRVARFDPAAAAEGGDGYRSRNDFAWVDLRTGQMLGNAGVWLKEKGT